MFLAIPLGFISLSSNTKLISVFHLGSIALFFQNTISVIDRDIGLLIVLLSDFN